MDTTTKVKLLRLSFRTQILPSSTQPQSSRREIDNHPRKGKKEDIETIERDLEGADMVVEAEEKMVLKDVTLMIMIRRETATTKGGEHMMMITMMRRKMTTVMRMIEDRVVAIATESQGRTMDTRAEEVTDETVEVAAAEEETTETTITEVITTTTEAVIAGEVIKTTATNKETTEPMNLVKLKMRREFFMSIT